MGKGQVTFVFTCLPEETEWVRKELKEICTSIREFWCEDDEGKRMCVTMPNDEIEEFRLWWIASFGWNPDNSLREEYVLDFSHTGINHQCISKENLYLTFAAIFKIDIKDIVTHFIINKTRVIFD